jgi:hypothetical protein
MPGNKGKMVAFICLLLVNGASGLAKIRTGKDSSGTEKCSLTVYINAGGSYFSTKPGIPDHLETEVYLVKPAGTLRVLWHPGHRLAIGLESGITEMYSYKLLNTSIPGELNISSVPLLLEFSMPLTRRVRLFAGAGYYFETSRLRYEGEVSSGMISPGWMAAGSYSADLSERVSLGAEIKWLNASEAQHAVLCAQLQLAWRILKW